jgi:hypothetical protein
MNEIVYRIDGINLACLGLNTSASDGVIDKLSIKGITKVSHPGEHGEDVDLSEYRYNVRKLSFKCWMAAEDNADLIHKQQKVAEIIGKNRLLRLEIVPDRFTPLVFDVYCPDGIVFNKEWNEEGEAFAEFTLNFIEPQPIKKVFVTRAPKEPVIEINSETPIQISWGDGMVEKYCFSGTYAHPYTDNIPKHYIIVSGVLKPDTIIKSPELVCSVLL